MSQYLAVFAAVFLAELGDKTQLATLLFASTGRHHPAGVFAAAALALVVSTAVAVFLGVAAEHHLSRLPLRPIAGAAFMAIGAWMIWSHYAGG